MRTIYKYKLGQEIVNKIDSFSGAKFLSAGWDCDNNLCVWAEVDTSNPTKRFNIFCFGTGWEIFDTNGVLNFIGTVKDEPYIWHVYWED